VAIPPLAAATGQQPTPPASQCTATQCSSAFTTGASGLTRGSEPARHAPAPLAHSESTSHRQ
jgi:hypothetical protein